MDKEIESTSNDRNLELQSFPEELGTDVFTETSVQSDATTNDILPQSVNDTDPTFIAINEVYEDVRVQQSTSRNMHSSSLQPDIMLPSGQQTSPDHRMQPGAQPMPKRLLVAKDSPKQSLLQPKKVTDCMQGMPPRKNGPVKETKEARLLRLQQELQQMRSKKGRRKLAHDGKVSETYYIRLLQHDEVNVMDCFISDN